MRFLRIEICVILNFDIDFGTFQNFLQKNYIESDLKFWRRMCASNFKMVSANSKIWGKMIVTTAYTRPSTDVYLKWRLKFTENATSEVKIPLISCRKYLQ